MALRPGLDAERLQLVLHNATLEGSNSGRIRVYATNYNVLRIMSGMGGLVYAGGSSDDIETTEQKQQRERVEFLYAMKTAINRMALLNANGALLEHCAKIIYHPSNIDNIINNL